jgi:hypothetical protein
MKEGFTRTCPRCGYTAEYRTVHSTPGPAVGSGFVKLEPAWVCTSPECGYYEADPEDEE